MQVPAQELLEDPAPRGLRAAARLPNVAGWTLGLAPVLYLALNGGGYDVVAHSQIGVLAWWAVLCGTAIGLLPAVKVKRAAWAACALLCAYVAWNALGIAWSSSAERSLEAVSLTAVYAGVFVLGALVLDTKRLRSLLNGIACALGIVGVLSVLSRLHPQWFPVDQVSVFFGHSDRLDYPVNYADGLGELLAIGVPLLLGVSVRARTRAGSALAAAALPVLSVGIVLTISRGGAIAAALGGIVLLALLDKRLPAITTALVAGAGSAVAIAALISRTAVRENLSSHLASVQRGEMIVILLVVCAAVALLQAALLPWARRGLSRRRRGVPARKRAAPWALVATTAVVAAVAAGAPAAISGQWHQFQRANVVGSSASDGLARFGTLSGSHRYQYWRQAVAEFDTSKLHGTGPGTFQFWWLAHNTVSEYVRNAHSLYLEALGETGIIGLALLLAFVLGLICFGVWRCFRSHPSTRRSLAIAVAVFTTFALSAAYDWVWQISAIPVAAMLAGAGIVAASRRGRLQERRSDVGPADSERAGGGSANGRHADDGPTNGERGDGKRLAPRRSRNASSRTAARAAFALAALSALFAIVVPLASTVAVRSSERAARAGDLRAALRYARQARAIEPYAATPHLQEALLLERDSRYPQAAAAAAAATSRSPQDWQLWLVRSRIEAENGRFKRALAQYKRARSLNPRSPLFS